MALLEVKNLHTFFKTKRDGEEDEKFADLGVANEIVYAKANCHRYLQKLVRKRVEHLAEVGDKVEPTGNKPIQEVGDGSKKEYAERDVNVKIFGAVHSKKHRDKSGYAKKP